MLSRRPPKVKSPVRSNTPWRQAVQFAFWLAFTGVMVMALKPSPGDGAGFWDKAQHFTAFYVLAALGAVAFARRPVWVLAAALVALGGLIEGLQATPLIHRDAEFSDWIADGLGVACALGPMLLPRLRRALTS